MSPARSETSNSELLTLLHSAQGTEHLAPEFKLELHLDSPAQRATLAKDVALQTIFLEVVL